MKILPNGYFSIEYRSEDLVRGLRPSNKLPRNNLFLSVCKGAVGQEGALKTLDPVALTTALMESAVVVDDFPFPQLFVLERLVLVCNRASIYEYVNGLVTLGIEGLTGGGKWALASSHEFIYLSNGSVSLVRDPGTRTWSLNTEAPKSSAICNFNGQIIVGNPK